MGVRERKREREEKGERGRRRTERIDSNEIKRERKKMGE